jgi:hypothetical protein
MPAPVADSIILGAVNPIEGKVAEVPSHQAINEKIRLAADEKETSKDSKDDDLGIETTAIPPTYDSDSHEKDSESNDVIIITGADAATHLLPLRDDGDPALTFRSLFLATILSGFQASMYQIYQVS